MRGFLGLALLLVCSGAYSADTTRPVATADSPVTAEEAVGGFVTVGLSSGKLHEEDDPYTYEVDPDAGGGLNLTGGVRFKPNIMVRLGLDGVTSDSGKACVSGSGCTAINTDVKVRETRADAFYAPPMGRRFGWRVGGGYERISVEFNGTRNVMDGVIIEGGFLVNAGKVVTFDIGLAAMGLQDDFGQDVGGGEFSGTALFHIKSFDLGVTGRAVGLETDVTGSGSKVKDDFSEVRLTAGWQWGYGAHTDDAPVVARPRPRSRR